MQPWLVLERNKYNDIDDIVSALVDQGYKVSDWIVDIASRLNKKSLPNDIWLYRVCLADLGLSAATTLENVYATAAKAGYGLLDPSVALYTRTLYDEQPIGEWLRIAVPLDSMIDSDGIPHLPKLGHALNSFYIETYWSWPHAIFHPTNEFVFQRDQ